MSEIIHLSPGLQVWQALPRVIATLFKKNKGNVPDMVVEQSGVQVPRERLVQYNKVCGFAESLYIPSTFLYVLSQPAQMTLLTQPSVPFALPGMVHFANRIRQFRPVPVMDSIHFKVQFGPMIAHDKGQAFEMLTTASVDGEIVWESLSVYLRKGKPGTGAPFEWPETSVAENATKEKWHLDSGLGLRYGKVSGDYNPIHMHPLTARLFGMPRHIIHGMYNKGRILADLLPSLGSDRYEIGVAFKVPMELPADIIYRHNTAENGFVFDVVDNDEVKPHLRGYLKKL